MFSPSFSQKSSLEMHFCLDAIFVGTISGCWFQQKGKIWVKIDHFYLVEMNIKNVSNHHLVVCLIYYKCKNISIQMQVLLTRKDFSPHLSKRNSPCLHDAGPRPIDHPMSPVFGVSVWWCWLMEIPKNVIISTSWDSRNVMILYI